MVLPSNNTEASNSDKTCSENYNYNTTQSGSVNHSNFEKYDWSEHTQGLILSSFYWGFIVTSTLGGTICQKFGGKKTLGLGILLASLFTIVTPLCIGWGSATALIVLRVATGLGEGILYPATGHLLAHWIPKYELSKAVTIVFSGSPIVIIFGMLVSGIILENAENNWSMVFYFYGGFGLISYALIAVLCYDQPSKNPFISKKELRYLNKEMKNIHGNIPATPWRHILTSPAVWASFAAKFGNTWICMTAINEIPKYMSSVLKISALHNGFFSSIPFLSVWLGGTLTCWIADKIIADGIISMAAVRKIGCTISAIGPGIFLVAASYAGCNGLLVVALQAAGLLLNGFAYFSVLINVLDLSPNYASAIEGLGDAIATVSGILAPYLVGVITPNQTLSEWQLVFWIVFAIAVIYTAIFLIFGSSEVQEWNDPVYLNTKITIDGNEVSKDDYLLSTNKQ